MSCKVKCAKIGMGASSSGKDRRHPKVLLKEGANKKRRMDGKKTIQSGWIECK